MERITGIRPLYHEQHTRTCGLGADIKRPYTKTGSKLNFQPIFDLSTGRTAEFEALIPVNHTAIISIAEENVTIPCIGNVILDQAIANLATLSRIIRSGAVLCGGQFLAVPVPAGIICTPGWRSQSLHIAPSRLFVDITKATIMRKDPKSRTILDTIHQLSCRIALDDFGAGYSSLSYLNHLSVYIVQIDQSFTRSICEDSVEVRRRSRMLMEGIAAISHKMNCTMIAESIETEEQKALLVDIGTDYGYSYLYARLKSVAAFIAAAAQTDITSHRHPAS